MTSLVYGFLYRSRVTRTFLRMACFVSFMNMVVWNIGHAATADEAEQLENSIKAAFLYKFASYVDWPEKSFPDPDSPITIAVLGDEEVAAELRDIVAGRTAQDRPIRAIRIRADEPIPGIHILFVGTAAASRLERVAQAARPHSTLLVTDSKGALTQGSMINFVLADRRLRFEISLPAVEHSGLRLSSRLLAVALHVQTVAP